MLGTKKAENRCTAGTPKDPVMRKKNVSKMLRK
jgi:hypothetical protein